MPDNLQLKPPSSLSAACRRISSTRLDEKNQTVQTAVALRATGDEIVQVKVRSPGRLKSMFESSLKNTEQFPTPQLKALDVVRKGLEGDSICHAKKYGVGCDPSPSSARFNVVLPKGPQHLKYCSRSRATTPFTPSTRADTASCNDSAASTRREVGDTAASCNEDGAGTTIGAHHEHHEHREEEHRGAIPGGIVAYRPVFQVLHHETSTPRFNKSTLHRWFETIDRSGTGVISQRELIVALREKKDLLTMLITRMHEDMPEPAPAPPRSPTPSLTTDLIPPTPNPRSRRGSARPKSPLPPSLRDKEKEAQAESNPHAARVIDARNQRAAIYRIKEILREVVTDGSGAMGWNEFVDFFRRAGFLLEYGDEHMNSTSLSPLNEALSEKQGDVQDLDVPLTGITQRSTESSPVERLGRHPRPSS